MALNKAVLKSTINNAITGIDMTSTGISAQIINIICDAVDTYIKAATITVNTTGTAAAQTGTGVIS